MKHESVTQLVKVCCGMTAIAVPTLSTNQSAQAVTPVAEAVPPPAAPAPVKASVADVPIPAPQPVVEAPPAPAFTAQVAPAMAESVVIDKSIKVPTAVSVAAPEPVADLAESRPVSAASDTPEMLSVMSPAIALEVTAERAPAVSAAPMMVSTAPVTQVSVPPAPDALGQDAPAAVAPALDVPVEDGPDAVAAAPEAAPVLAAPAVPNLDVAVSAVPDLDVLPTPTTPTLNASSPRALTVASAAPEEGSASLAASSTTGGTATDLNQGVSYTVSRRIQTEVTPSYDLTLSAAQLTDANRSPQAVPDLSGALDRLGLQWDGIRTDTDVARLDVDYGAVAGQPAGQVKTTGHLANAYYDVPTGGPLRPYVGVGLGYANLAQRPDSSATPRSTETRFAYQLRTGLRYEVAPQVAVNVGYRYFAVPGQVRLGGQQQSISSGAIEVGLQARF